MRVAVDQDKCVGSGQCVPAAERVFDQRDEDGVVVLLDVQPPKELDEGVRLAVALLCAAVSAVLTGARSLIAISEWITDAPQYALGVLGFAADPLTGLRPVPHAATVRRLLQRVDGDALDAAIGAFLQARMPPPAEPETPHPRAPPNGARPARPQSTRQSRRPQERPGRRSRTTHRLSTGIPRLRGPDSQQ